MTTKHTPAPWIDNGEGLIVSNKGDVATIAAAYDLHNDYTGTEQEANARLIAAAPELLELLEGLTFIAETVAHLRGLERDILPTTDKARKLIARVKG